MQRAARRRCEPCAGYMRLMRFAALYTGSVKPRRAAGSLPVQKSQTSERGASGKRMGFGIDVHLGKPALGLRVSGVMVRGSVSTKVFGRRLVEHDRNSLKRNSEAIARAGLASSFGEPNAGVISKEAGVISKGAGIISEEAGDSEALGVSDAVRLQVDDRELLQEVVGCLDWKYSLKPSSSGVDLGFVSREAGGSAGRGESRSLELLMKEQPSSCDPSDMAMLDQTGDASVGEEFASEMKLGSGEGVTEEFTGGGGVRNAGVWGAMQPLPGDEGVSVVCKQGLGSGIGRQLTIRTSGEHKLRAVSTGAVETVGMERENPEAEGDVLDRVEKLRQVIADYSYRYHTLDNPVVSDSAYDALVRELKELESQLPAEASKESVTSKVGAPPALDLAKVRHAVPMLSLAAVYKEDELRAWHERLQQRLNKVSDGEQPSTGAWVVEPKVDGLALTLRYEGGRLVCAATRGDGSEGEDVTYNARNLTGIPQVLPELHGNTNLHASVVEVRGEVYMTLLDFQELNAIKVKAGEKPFANPRNAAAGSIRILKNRDGVDRRLSFMAYAIVSAEDTVSTGLETSGQLAKTQWDALNLLKKMGFSVNDDNRKFDSFEDALDYATRWRDSRPSLKYESDGVIFKVNDLAVQAKLGAVGSDPRWAVAWKFAATEVVTVLEGIELTIGRSGAIIPNARLKPVDLGGVTISRASLHNFGMVEKLGICEGDHVVVQRAGDVIPQVVQVLKALRPDHVQLWVPPERCPSCDGELTVSKDKTMTSCCNNKCPGRHSRKIEHFAKTLFKGLGPAILGDLQDAGMVADPADFYALDAVTLSRLEGLGKKSATKLVKTIEESKGKPLWELVTALGIPTVGVSAAKHLEKWFGSMDRLLLASKEELQLVPGVGTVSAAAIQDWCTNPFNVQLVSRIKDAGFAPIFNDPEIEKQTTISASSDSALQKKMSKAPRAKKILSKKSEVKSAPSMEDSQSFLAGENSEMEGTEEIVEQPPLHGKNVVITGEFENYSREELEQLVILNGGQIRKSVSSKTSFIVAGQFPGPSKMAKATQLNIPVHDLSTFQQLLDHDSASVQDFKQAMSG